MHYEAKTPEDYLKQLEPDWRKDKLEAVRTLIKSSGPELSEEIKYGMLSFIGKSGSVFHLNAQKNYVSLYVGNISKIENSEELLKGFDRGKGCIRIKKNIDLSETRINEFIEQTLEVWRQGGDTAC
jgi:uncharacterized protein YdhG (YjbR/CyaY superfamily)